jgi:nitrogen fixation NifU-like protein
MHPPALYNDTVLDHFLNPRNVGDLPEPDGVGQAGQSDCGDSLKLSLRINHGKIVEARFRASGCPAAIASSSMATELIKGRTVAQARHFSNREVVAALGGLPPAKVQCSVLAAQALRSALADYRKKRNASVTGGMKGRAGTPLPAAARTECAPYQQ